MDGWMFSDPGEIISESHVNRGHASARRLRRVLVASDGEITGMAHLLGGALEQCDVCRAFDKAAHTPIAGTPTVSTVQ